MDKFKHKRKRRIRRHGAVRKSVAGTPSRPRMAIFRSLNHIYVQVIDDLAGTTLVAASSRESAAGCDKTGNRDAATAVGKLVAERAKEKGINEVCFDRGGFQYHGRVKALADAAREAGLKF